MTTEKMTLEKFMDSQQMYKYFFEVYHCTEITKKALINANKEIKEKENQTAKDAQKIFEHTLTILIDANHFYEHLCWLGSYSNIPKERLSSFEKLFEKSYDIVNNIITGVREIFEGNFC